jgi:hypothetical protein
MAALRLVADASGVSRLVYRRTVETRHATDSGPITLAGE